MLQPPTPSQLREPLVGKSEDELLTSDSLNPSIQSYLPDDKNTGADYLRAANFIQDAIHLRQGKRKQDSQAQRFYALYYSRLFKCFMWGVILVHFNLIWFEDPAQFFIPQWALLTIEGVCLLSYCFELFVKTRFVDNTRMYRNRLHWLVIGCICLTVLDMMTYKASKVRWSRILRPAFVGYWFRPLRIFLREVWSTMGSILEAFAVITFFISFAVVFCVVIFEGGPLAEPGAGFGSLWEATRSLFVLWTTANYPDIMMPGYRHSRATVFVFVVYIVVTMFILKSLLLGVIYNQYTSQVKRDLRNAKILERSKLKESFDILTRYTPPGGLRYVTLPLFISLFRELRPSASTKRAKLLYKILDTNNTQRLSFREFKGITNLLKFNISSTKTDDNIFSRCIPKFYNSRFSNVLKYCVQHVAFSVVVTLMIVINAALVLIEQLLVEKLQQGKQNPALVSFNKHKAWTEILFFFVFFVEMFLKIYSFGPRNYWKKNWNKFDCLIVITSLFDLILNATIEDLGFGLLKFLLLIRVLRLLRLFGRLERFNVIMTTIFQLVVPLINLFAALAVVSYVFAVIGMLVWAGKMTPLNPALNNTEYAELEYWGNSFNNYGESLVTLFELMVVNNWHVIAAGFAAASTQWAWLFFMLFHLVTAVVLVNILIAVILDGFVAQWQVRKQGIKSRVQIRIEMLDKAHADINDLRTVDNVFKSKTGKRKQYIAKRKAGGVLDLLEDLFVEDEEESFSVSHAFIPPRELMATVDGEDERRLSFHDEDSVSMYGNYDSDDDWGLTDSSLIVQL